MNSQQAKQYNIVKFLSENGTEPMKIKNNDYFYSSPFREDKEPSFHVDASKNVWFDFGIGEGGSIIDLILKLNGGSFKEALQVISDREQIPQSKIHFSFHQQGTNKITDFTISELKNNALVEYAKERGIEMPYIKRYCQEANYMSNSKKYFSIAFKTDKNTYELRNKYFKGNYGGKSISSKNTDSEKEKVFVFEGFFSFLSYLQFYNISSLNYLVLNSISLKNEALHFLNNFEEINLYLDNDLSGKTTTKFFIENLHSKNVIDCSHIYSDFNDFNDFLLMKRKNNVIFPSC